MRKAIPVAVLFVCGLYAQQPPPLTPGTPPAPPAAVPPPAVPPLPPGPTLSLAQATALAIQSHPIIAAARDTALTAGQHITEAKAPYYPVLEGDVTGEQGLGGARVGAGALSATQLFNRFGQGLTVSQLVTDFGRTKNLVAASQYQAQAAGEATQARTYDVVLGVNRAYFGLLQAQADVRVAAETVHARQTLANQVTALANAALKSQLDVSFATVSVSEAQLLLIRSQDAVAEAYTDLARALGQDQVVEYQVTDVAVPGAPPPSADGLISQAIQSRPELKDLQFQVQGAQSFERAEADLTHPSVSGVAVAGGLPYLSQDPRVAPYGYEGAALNLQVPIFNGHLFSARKQAAHYDAEAAGERLRNVRQQIERDVRNAWISASTAWQRIPVTEELIRQANLAENLAQGRYNLGLASIVEITQAQLSVTEAQIENVSARYEYQVAYAQLQYAIGALR